MSLAAPAFNLTAGPAAQLQSEPNAPIQQVVELTEAQITAAISHNNFVLGDAAARNEILSQIGGVAAGTFDQAAVQTLANYQETNTITRQDGRLDKDTLDFIIRAMVDAGDHAGVITVITDFFNLNELQVASELAYDATATGDAAGSTSADTGNAVWTLGPDSFANGLDGLGAAVDTAIGAGTSMNSEALDVMTADTNADRRTAMWSNPDQDNEDGLVPWIRENFPTEADLSAFLARTDLTDAQKTAAFGRITVELGRLEYLMGVMYHGGNDQTWENLNTPNNNRGTFVNHFKEAVGNNPNGSAWCTMFSGYLKTLLGFSDDLADGGPLIFNSGARLDWWATAGTNFISGADDFSDPSDFDDYSGAAIDTADWTTLRTSLSANGLTDEQKETAVDDFLADRTTPQPGDVLIMRIGATNNSYGGGFASHTMTIESYNDYTISSIEGNRGQKVTGTELDLRDSADVGSIICLIRAGVEFFTENEAPAAEAVAPENAGPEGEGAAADQAAAEPVANVIEEADIINPLKQMVRNLQLMADQKEYVDSNAAGASVADMAGNSAGNETE
jgi:hypothetical protein